MKEEDPDKGSNVPKIVVIAACRDEGGCIREILDGRSRQKFETGSRYSQLKLMHGSKAFFAGIQSEGSAGSVQVIPYPFDRFEEEDHKLEDIQLHDVPITRIALDYGHSLLFTGAEDGSLSIMAITDRPKGSLRDVSSIHEVLIQGKIYR